MSTSVEILGLAREPAWLPWAVQYFFLIGISAAAFFLSLPGYLLRKPHWSTVSRQALLVALVCGITAPVALLSDLHQPGRFLNFYLHPNLDSWMAWGSFFIPVYLGALLLYAWLCLWPAQGRLPLVASAVMAGIGALLIFTYTGMEVMAVRARPLWNSPLVPLLFAATAFGAALGMTALFAAVPGHRDAAAVLNRWMAASQVVVLGLFAAWLASGYAGLSAGAAEVLDAVAGSAAWALTLASPAIVAVLALLAAARSRGLVLPGLLALAGAWVFRWVLFMDGQAIPKVGTAFHDYALTFTPDGLLGIAGTAGLFLAVYIVLTSFVPSDKPATA